MQNPIVIVGIGEMGGVFARAFLKAGYPVHPAGRTTDLEALAEYLPEPAFVLVAVGEADLHPVLARIPDAWRGKLALLQNELLPMDWRKHDIPNPTVVSVWFEKKPGQDAKVVYRSPAWGPHAAVLVEALQGLGLPALLVEDEADMLFELVVKNLYILTTNIAGLKTGGTVESLWHDHRDVAEAVFDDVCRLQEALTGVSFERQALLDAMLEAFDGDPDHGCMGRSAPARRERALARGAELGVALPAIAAMPAKV